MLLFTVNVYLRLTAAIAAIDSSTGKPIVAQLQSGRTVRVTGVVRESGFVDITCGDRTYAVLNSDLVLEPPGVCEIDPNGPLSKTPLTTELFGILRAPCRTELLGRRAPRRSGSS